MQASTWDELLVERLPQIGWFPEQLKPEDRIACGTLAAGEVVSRHEPSEIVTDPWPYATATLRRLSGRSGWDCIVVAIDPVAAPSRGVRRRLPPQRLRECLRKVPFSIAEVRAGTEGIVMAVGVKLKDIGDDTVHALLNCDASTDAALQMRLFGRKEVVSSMLAFT